jgi:NitT/TauT family transport system substrate-binding protein
MKQRNLIAGALGVALLAVSAHQAPAQTTKVVVGYTATADFASGFIALDQGLFKKRGLDVEFKLVPLNSQLPAAVQSDSITMGGTTVSVLLQAIDGGLDHVAVAGSGVTWKGQDSFGAVVRADVPYAKPEDFIGKKVGAPGIGAFLQVLFRNWLLDSGVDYKKVTFVEVSFPQMADVLKGGNVDAVVTGEPIMGRIVSAGIGKQVTTFTDNLKGDLPIIVYSATRKWAEANPAAVKAFQEAIVEGAAIANKDPAAVRTSVANYIKMPPEVIASMKLGRWQADVTEAGMAGWVEIMKKQDMLRTAIDAKKIIAR